LRNKSGIAAVRSQLAWQPNIHNSARNLYQYYSAKADEMATHAADYEHRAQDTASRGTAAIDADSQTHTTK
jgi:hypothetical protein